MENYTVIDKILIENMDILLEQMERIVFEVDIPIMVESEDSPILEDHVILGFENKKHDKYEIMFRTIDDSNKTAKHQGGSAKLLTQQLKRSSGREFAGIPILFGDCDNDADFEEKVMQMGSNKAIAKKIGKGPENIVNSVRDIGIKMYQLKTNSLNSHDDFKEVTKEIIKRIIYLDHDDSLTMTIGELRSSDYKSELVSYLDSEMKKYQNMN